MVVEQASPTDGENTTEAEQGRNPDTILEQSLDKDIQNDLEQLTNKTNIDIETHDIKDCRSSFPRVRSGWGLLGRRSISGPLELCKQAFEGCILCTPIEELGLKATDASACQKLVEQCSAKGDSCKCSRIATQ